MLLVKKRVPGDSSIFGRWVSHWALLCLLAVGLIPSLLMAQGEEPKFPFPAQVTQDKVLVRAGVGTTYYVVKELKKGEIVTVDEKIYQWYKIVPPNGVYSYVSKAFVDAKGDGKLGVVNKTPCEVFTASVNGVADSFRRTANLLKGDNVQIVGEDGGYYKILPPKGTYVYLPATSVEKVDFKPAVDETPVAPVTPAPVATPKPVAVTVAPVTVTPKPVVKPEVVTSTPDFVIEKSEPIVAEKITLPDPEKTVITSTPKPVTVAETVPAQPVKPVVTPVPTPAPVAVVTPAPKPVAQPVVAPVTTPAPRTVEVTDSAPRPLVINKPLPGDSTVSTSVTPTVTTPNVTVEPTVTSTPAAVVSTPVTRSRSTPPIPDTETPPDFEGLPMHAANPSVVPAHTPVVAAVPSTAPVRRSAVDMSSTDTTLPLNTEELVVDKPVTQDRLDTSVPSKPDLPVMVESSTPAQTLVVPALPATVRTPVNDGTLPAVAAPVTPAPVVNPVVTTAPVATATAAPVSTPTPAPAPAIAPKPTVNPLLATRSYFKPQSEMLVKLEDKLVEAYNDSLDRIPLDKYLNAYQQIGTVTELSIGDQRIVKARELMLKRDIQLANALRSIGTVQRYEAPAPMPTTPVQPAQPVETTYAMTGQLLASALYDGQNLPRLYRLVNPAQPSVTLIYVRPSDKLNPSAYLGRNVGINGEVQVDDALNLRLIDVQEIGLQ